jgi:hypothetical protein
MTSDPPVPDEDKLDETLEETFPASDAPANTVETGVGVGGQETPQDDAVDADDAAKPKS